ncbi:hypothetical protein J2Z84_004505 [Agrobacterium rubi]|nr:hypothetical protein [Agrobacterium rubi]
MSFIEKPRFAGVFSFGWSLQGRHELPPSVNSVWHVSAAALALAARDGGRTDTTIATLIYHPEPVEGERCPAGRIGSIPHPEVPRRGLEGRGLRAWGRVRGGCFESTTCHLFFDKLRMMHESGVCRSPPLPCQASPPQGGRSARGAIIAPIAAVRRLVGNTRRTQCSSATLKMTGKRAPSRSPHLRGRCPAGQRGVSGTLRSHNRPPKPPATKILPNQINLLPENPQKTPKVPPQLSPRRANHPHNCSVPPSDTPQGVAARRDRRWWERGYASSLPSGSSSNSPGGTGG